MKKNNFSSLCGNHRDIRSVKASFFELDGAITKSIQRVVFTHTNVHPRVVDSTTLTNDNVAGNAMLSTEYLYAESFAFGFAAVTGTSYSFFMSHDISILRLSRVLIDAVYLYLGQIVAMSIHFLVALTTDFLEHQNLFSFEVFQDGCLDRSPCDVRLTYSYSTIIVLEHHGVKSYLASLFVLKAVYEDLLILSYLELLSCYFYNCVHFIINLLFLLTKRNAKVVFLFFVTKYFFTSKC